MKKKPIILFEGQYTFSDLEKLKSKNPIWRLVDIYEIQAKELFEILNPADIRTDSFGEKLDQFLKEHVKSDQPFGNWIYYPWNGILVHTVNEENYFTLRTNRNRNIITHDEQKRLYQSRVGIVGLSIGSHFAQSLVYGGIADKMTLVEFDTLETSNLNRVNAHLYDVGSPKLDFITQQIYEINPYAELTLINGLKKETMETFFEGSSPFNIIFEAIDDFEMKIRLRLAAKQKKIPVVMLTNLGDNVMIDVERYDLDKDLALFNGLIGDTPEQILSGPISEKDKVKYALGIVGKENIPTRALETLFEINKTLVGRPQINSSVATAGGIASFLARRLILGKKFHSGRYMISLNQLFGDDEEFKETNERKLVLEKLARI